MPRFALLLAILLVSTTPARAEFSYDFVDVFYGQIDFDDTSLDGDTFGARLSLSINDDFHLFGGAGLSDLDFSADATSWQAGVGYNTELSPVVDLVAQVSFRRVELDTPFFNATDDGIGLGLTFRVAMTDLVEFNGTVDYADLDDSGDDVTLGGAVLFNLTERLSLGLFGNFADDVSEYSLLGRVYF